MIIKKGHQKNGKCEDWVWWSQNVDAGRKLKGTQMYITGNLGKIRRICELREEIISRYIGGRSKKGPLFDGSGEGCWWQKVNLDTRQPCLAIYAKLEGTLKLSPNTETVVIDAQLWKDSKT